MRIPPIICLVAVALALGCEKKPVANPLAEAELVTFIEEGPMPVHLQQDAIPQDRKKIEKDRADFVAWYRSTTVDAYNKVGYRNAKWDEAAVDALEKLARSKATHDRDVDAFELAYEALDRAVKLGCDDPLICYHHAKSQYSYLDLNTQPHDLQQLVGEKSFALLNSDYPALRRANAAHNYALTLAADPKTAAKAEGIFSKSRELFREALDENRRYAGREFFHCAELAMEFGAQTTGRTPVYEAYADCLGDGDDTLALRSLLRGKYLLNSGWDIRGSAFAAQVPEARMKQFVEKLGEAAEELVKAWNLDPSATEAAIGLIAIAGAFGERDEMEKWFQLAMKADGDCVEACETKLNYLLPQWGGHADAMRQFARRMVETKNWEAGLPARGIKVYETITLVYYRLIGVIPADWPVVSEHFEVWVKARPDSRWAWSDYCFLAERCEQKAAVRRAVENLKGNPSLTRFRADVYGGIEGRARRESE